MFLMCPIWEEVAVVHWLVDRSFDSLTDIE